MGRRILVLLWAVGCGGGLLRAEDASGLSIEDLGFSTKQTQADSATQEVLHRRSRNLKTHQLLGLATMVPMTLTLMTAGKAAEGSAHDRSVHAGLAATSGVMYFTTAGFAWAAPEVDEKPSTGVTRWHKALAFIHVPCMIVAPILGYQAYKQKDHGEEVHGSAKYHNTVAGVGYAAFMAAGILMTFNF